MNRTILAIFAFLFFTTPTLFGANLGVPVPYATLADAIGAAQEGDTIALDSGVYRGTGFKSLKMPKTISVIGIHGREHTIIDLQGDEFLAIDTLPYYQTLWPWPVIRGLTIRNGSRGIWDISGYSFVSCRFVHLGQALTPATTHLPDYNLDSCLFDSNFIGAMINGDEELVEATDCAFRSNTYAVFLDFLGNLSAKRVSFVNNDTACNCWGGYLTLYESFLAYNQVGVVCRSYWIGPYVQIERCLTYGQSVDTIGIPGFSWLRDNLEADPYLCSTDAWDFSISSLSPLLPANNPTEKPIGFFTSIGCYCGDVDTNGSGPDIGDLTRLIDFLFMSGAPITPSNAGEIDPISGTDIGDLTYLISYLFLSGSPPGC